MRISPLPALLSALASLLFAAAAASAGDIEDAQKLAAEGRYAEALPKYEAAAAADPGNAAAAEGLSRVLAGLGRFLEAAKAVDAAREANPRHVGLLLAKARAFLLLADQASRAEEPDAMEIESHTTDAERWVKEALAIDPAHVEARVLKGRVLRLQGGDEAALPVFEAVAKEHPEDFDANWDTAMVFFNRAGKDHKNTQAWANAERYFAAALAADPKSGPAALNVAHCKAWQQAPAPDVAAAYLRAAELMPGNEEPLRKYYPYGRKDPAANLAAMQKLAAARPRDVTLKMYLAYAHLDAKQPDKAVKVLGEAADLDPQNPWVQVNLGDVLLADGKEQKALKAYETAVKYFKGKMPQNVYDKLAYNVAVGGRGLSTDQRDELWELLWKDYPDRAGAANNAGLFYRDNVKDYEKSLSWYLRAATAAPEDACIQNDTGLVWYYHMHDAEKAEPFFRKAIEVGEKNKYHWNADRPPGMGYRDAMNSLGLLLLQEKRWKDLKKYVEEHVPEGHPKREEWLRAAEEHR